MEAAAARAESPLTYTSYDWETHGTAPVRVIQFLLLGKYIYIYT